MRDGVTMTTTLLAKDTSHRNVFAVFAAGGGMGLAEMEGAGNFVMVADPATFRVLPWADSTGWVLCDIYFPNGKPVPFSTRELYRDALAQARQGGLRLFRRARSRIPSVQDRGSEAFARRPDLAGRAAGGEHTTHGFQYLTEARFDQVEPILEVLRKTMQALGLPLRSLEVELGPSQYEFTFAPEPGLAPADTMVLFRSAMKQVARRHGYLVSFMCRPGLPNTLASGWHLHQSLLDRKTGPTPFVSQRQERTALAARPAFSRGPAGACARGGGVRDADDQRLQALSRRQLDGADPGDLGADNRGVMVRVMGEPGDPATHLENRVGEPLANPYLYMASQIHAGLDGVARKLDPGPSADSPYEISAEPLPKSLDEALAALKDSACFRAGFGDVFVDYLRAHQGRRDRALRRRDRTAKPATLPTSPTGSRRNISIWPDIHAKSRPPASRCGKAVPF